MRTPFLLAALALAACVESAPQRGVGFDRYDAARQTAAAPTARTGGNETVTTERTGGTTVRTYEYGRAPAAVAGTSTTAGAYAARDGQATEGRAGSRAGMPFYVSKSRDYAAGRNGSTMREAAGTAAKVGASFTTPAPGGPPMNVAGKTVSMRWVWSDGHDFILVEEARAGLGSADRNFVRDAVAAAAAQSQCRPAGGAYLDVRNLKAVYIVPVTC